MFKRNGNAHYLIMEVEFLVKKKRDSSERLLTSLKNERLRDYESGRRDAFEEVLLKLEKYVIKFNQENDEQTTN
jgi:hypothetical protein